MSGVKISQSSALSKDVKASEAEWNSLLKSALYFQKVMYKWMTVKACSDFRMMMNGMPTWRSSKSLKAFHDADRMSVLNSVTVEYETHHEVLELVLSKNFSVGGRFSRKYTAIVECPDRKELVPIPPPPPKGAVDQLKESVSDLVRTVTLQPRRPEPPSHRWVQVDPQVFEIHLFQDGYIRTHRISKDVAVFARRASVDEIRPYTVEFHISQKAWYERTMSWMTQRAATAALQTHQCATLPARCGPELDRAVFDTASMDSFLTLEDNSLAAKAKKEVPVEIAVVSSRDVKTTRKNFKAAPSIIGVWISDFDVVVGVSSDAASTVATDIMKHRVVPFFASKTELRPSQVRVMIMMLQEELKDDERFADMELPMATFWMKLSDCPEEVRKKENLKTKWLRKDNGDFMGPFVQANEDAIHKAAVEWVKESALEQSKAQADEPRDPKDPEPSIAEPVVSPLFEETPVLPDPVESPSPQPQEQPTAIVSFTPRHEGPLLFNLPGPLDNLDQQARELCQEWVNNSESLLIKAAKKTLIDSFQADFSSFLFLFQLQLKRIKGGYDKITSSDAPDAQSQADDTSWVSADPSVEEESTRVADIEQACIDFMNQMGNNMVKQYERLSGTSSNNSVKKAPSEQEQRDEDVDEVGSRSSGRRSIVTDYVRNHDPSGSSIQVKNRRNLIVPDAALILKNGMQKVNPAETSLTLSEASTVRGVANRSSGDRDRNERQPAVRSGLPPRSPTRRRREEEEEDDYDDDYTDEEATFRSEPTYESFEETVDSLDEEDDDGPSYDSGRRNRRERRRDRRRGDPYDYDSPCTLSHTDGDDDTYPTVETEPLESITLSPSELSMEEAKPRQSWGLISLFG